MVYYLIRFASWLAGKTPRRVRLTLAGVAAEAIYLGWVSKRHDTIANMARVLGTTRDDPRARRLARISWRNFGRYVSDFIYMPNTTQEAIVARLRDTTPPPGAFALIEEARGHGKGVILVAAHFGAYDVAGIAVASRFPVHLIVETLDDARMDKMWQEQRRSLGMEVIRIEQSPRQMLRVLQDNGIIAVALDRPLPAGEGIPITFFGARCWVPGGIAQLAVRSGAAVVPGFCVYDEAYSTTYYLGAGPVLYPEVTGDRKADTLRLAQRMFDAIEEHIRERPDQWAMFRPFWQENNGGAAVTTRAERSAAHEVLAEPRGDAHV